MDMPVAPPLVMAPAGSHVRRALVGATRRKAPYRHWLLRDVLPADLCAGVTALPFEPPEVLDTKGKRDTNNASRIFVSEPDRWDFPACEALAEAFQDEATTDLLGDLCGIDLAGSYLRIECTLDTDGFWLESHTDIGAKLFTMLVYLSDHPDAEDWGTDIMDAEGNVLDRAPGTFNAGLIFIPGSDTWHGFARRPIRGVRRSVIINYVKPEWRARYELAYPSAPVGL
jgi:hypothetical protein